MTRPMMRIVLLALLGYLSVATFTSNTIAAEPTADFTLTTRQITFGPRHHFFGYIGHVRTIPWNASGRYLLALEAEFQDRMPKPGESANILLLDAQKGYAPRVIEKTRAWNPQQGTMLYWNPQAAETQFFFNDRDPETHEVFCVLFDISTGERVAEYRYPDASFGNGGVCQQGSYFLGINYGRMARLRPVTGYPGAKDSTVGGERHPANDGIFKVNVATKERQLLVSFKTLADRLRAAHPIVDEKELFINHTLWSRNGERIFFFARGHFNASPQRINAAFTMKSDGSDLRPLARHIGGHPEWESDRVLIGRDGKDQIRFDVERDEIVGKLGTPEIFPNPEGDVALSPDGKWFVNGHGDGGKNFHTVLRLSDGAWTRTAGLDQGGYIHGDLRIDPAPCWNRTGTQLLVTGIDEKKTRQMFVIDVQPKKP